MQLKKYTDYALRVLIFVGMKHEGELASIKEISETYNISHNHVSKVVHELSKEQLIETVQGRYGGIRLAKRVEEINVGEVVRKIEQDFVLLECFDREQNHCIISPVCKLKHALHEALEAFFAVLDGYTLEDLIVNEKELLALMGL